jgi:hypothetical protein
VLYTTEGVRVGDTLYPFPRPKYLLQLIKLCEHKAGNADAAPLLKLLTKARYQHAKEISENFGAVAAMRAAVDAAPGLTWGELCRGAVHVYVPGDGRRPFTAAAVCLTTPAKWQVRTLRRGGARGEGGRDTPARRLTRPPGIPIRHHRPTFVQVWSIDPVMIPDYCDRVSEPNGWVSERQTGATAAAAASAAASTAAPAAAGPGSSPPAKITKVSAAAAAVKTFHSWGKMASRLHCVRGTTQGFALPPPDAGTPALSVVLEVHSHCPLAEFVARVPPPALVISLPCCGKCGLVEGGDGLDHLLSYSDPDILSPHRDVHVHFKPRPAGEAAATV